MTGAPKRTPDGDTAQVVTRLPDWLRQAIERVSRKLHVSRSQVVRDACEEYVARHGEKRKRGE
jgi:metal-responsive CopG/Arc/MetJ family transcriptional regulator